MKKFLKIFKKVLYKLKYLCYNSLVRFERTKQSGPVVQSVSTPACHAGGRRFESVPGRQESIASAMDSFFI